jgi:guanylate cyclase
MMYLQSVMFELELIQQKGEVPTIEVEGEDMGIVSPKRELDARRGSQGIRSLLLKGQMRYISEMDAMVFLCSPL